MTSVCPPRRHGVGPSRTARVLGACALAGLPTAIWPGSEGAAAAYLVGLAAIVVTVVVAASRWRGAARLGWSLVAAAAACWLLGDLVQRVLVVFGGDRDVPGAPDVMWLASYPLMVTGVGAMIHGRRLVARVRREVALDVLVVTVAGALGAWKLMIAPELETGTLTMAVVLTVLYPLGDVALFATALTLLIAPGRPSAAGRMLVLCLGATLVLDALFTALPTVAPGFDVSRLDGALLVINGLLPAAALHASGAQLAEAPAAEHGGMHMHRWRVVLLGGGLVTVSVAAVLPASDATSLDTVILLSAAVATSVTVVARFYGVVRQREAAERRLDHQAHYDHLTGLPNRALLVQRLSDQLHRGARDADRDAPDPLLLYLDLDGFKAINDRHGHAAGDHVLHTIGTRLAGLTRLGDTVARLGGDEFVVLCSGVPAEAADQLGQKLCHAVVEPIVLPSGARVSVGASVGVTPVVASGTITGELGDVEGVLRLADAAMYQAKHRGGGVRVA